MKTIVKDIVAEVVGPGFRYKRSRVLWDSEGQAAVFTERDAGPVLVFEGTAPTNNLQGSGTFAGEPVAWRRVGANCSFPLAKCQIKTGPLAELWVNNE